MRPGWRRDQLASRMALSSVETRRSPTGTARTARINTYDDDVPGAIGHFDGACLTAFGPLPGGAGAQRRAAQAAYSIIYKGRDTTTVRVRFVLYQSDDGINFIIVSGDAKKPDGYSANCRINTYDDDVPGELCYTALSTREETPTSTSFSSSRSRWTALSSGFRTDSRYTSKL